MPVSLSPSGPLWMTMPLVCDAPFDHGGDDTPILERTGIVGGVFKMGGGGLELGGHQAIFRRVRASITLAALLGPCLARIAFEVFLSLAFIFLSVSMVETFAMNSSSVQL